MFPTHLTDDDPTNTEPDYMEVVHSIIVQGGNLVLGGVSWWKGVVITKSVLPTHHGRYR